MLRFANIPAVVPTFFDEVDFFPQVLANIGGPQSARFVEGQSPDISQPVGVNFRAGVSRSPAAIDGNLFANERVVGGNRIVAV